MDSRVGYQVFLVGRENCWQSSEMLSYSKKRRFLTNFRLKPRHIHQRVYLSWPAIKRFSFFQPTPLSIKPEIVFDCSI
jgi:hypothetical protein